MLDFMMPNPTAYGAMLATLNSVCPQRYLSPMEKITTKALLWENVLALMQAKYGGENLSRLARETGMGPGSASRIKAQETSVGVEVLEKIAEVFGVEPWQLLVPRLGAHLFEISEDQKVVPIRTIKTPPAQPTRGMRLHKTAAQKRPVGSERDREEK